MVVLSAAIISRRSSVILVSRQFVPVSRVRVEGMLIAFNKLLSAHQQLQSQHTYIESETLRYVYHPLDDSLYLVLTTNLSSNIVDDLYTIGMVSQSVKDVCGGWVSEDIVEKNAFLLINLFDEVLLPGGQRSATSLLGVQQALKMESQEEKLHKIIIQNKIEETKRTMKDKARELDREKAEKLRMERLNGGGSLQSSRSHNQSYSSSMGSISSYVHEANSYDSNNFMPSIENRRPKQKPASSLAPKRGMVLSKKEKDESIYESLVIEDGIADALPSRTAAKGQNIPASQPQKPIEIAMKELLLVHFHQDGTFDKMQIQGTLTVHVYDESAAKTKILVANNNKNFNDINFNFITHPKIDKSSFIKVDNNLRSSLMLKDRQSAFPMDTDLGLLKWRANVQETNSDIVPITVNCWPSESSNETYINVEYDAKDDIDLRRVKIIIPVPRSDNSKDNLPVVNSIDSGETSYDSKSSSFVWEIPLVDRSNRSGSIEFVMNFASPAASYFPIEVTFDAKSTLCNISVDAVISCDSDDGSDTVPFSSTKIMNTESYVIG